jgi:hypothetical protein
MRSYSGKADSARDDEHARNERSGGTGMRLTAVPLSWRISVDLGLRISKAVLLFRITYIGEMTMLQQVRQLLPPNSRNELLSKKNFYDEARFYPYSWPHSLGFCGDCKASKRPCRARH